MAETILLERAPDRGDWMLRWTGDKRDPYIANASAVSSVLNMIECGRMGELTKPEIKRLHFYMASYGGSVRIVVNVLGSHFAYVVSKYSIRLDAPC